jgi:hypothetical protein
VKWFYKAKVLHFLNIIFQITTGFYINISVV